MRTRHDPDELLRRRVRRPFRRAARTRAVAAAVALVVAAMVAERSSTAQRERSAWGTTVTVQVLERDLPAGATITAADLRAAPWPAALAPPGAADSTAVGRRVDSAVSRGEVLVGHRLAPDGAGTLGAQLDRGEVAVQVPLGEPPAAVEPGDLVDVIAPVDPTDPADSADAGAATLQVGVVARSARVLAVGGGAATLAVLHARAAAVAGAALTGMVALVVVG